MHSSSAITYVIKSGDNLYRLARTYKTTVPYLLALNPGIDPYNLQIGSTLNIIPGDGFGMPIEQRGDCAKRTGLINDMRLAWSQHVYWTRMLLLSIAHRLKDQSAVTARVMQNPQDIADIFARYYSPDVASGIARLLSDHLQIGAALITALRDNDKSAETLVRRWYQNADQMAHAFSSINPFYGYDEMRDMLHTHLDLTTDEVTKRLAGNFAADIQAMDAVEKEAMEMADFFVRGIMKQFPQMFN